MWRQECEVWDPWPRGQAPYSHICLFSCKMEILLQYLLFAEQNYRWERGFKSTKPYGIASGLSYMSTQFMLVLCIHSVPAVTGINQIFTCKAKFNALPFPPTQCIGNIICAFIHKITGHQALTVVSTVPGEAQDSLQGRTLFPLKLYHVCVFIYYCVVNTNVCVCVQACASMCRCVYTKSAYISTKHKRDP